MVILPHSSFAMKSTIIVPDPPQIVLVSSIKCVIVTLPQLSVASAPAFDANQAWNPSGPSKFPKPSHSTTLFLGSTVKVGLTLSSTVMVCLCEIEFPHSSVAVQTLVKTKLLSQDPAVFVSLKVTVAIPQLSSAVNVGAVGTSDEHSYVMFCGKSSTKVGLVLSSTVIICVCVVVFPQASFAV